MRAPQSDRPGCVWIGHEYFAAQKRLGMLCGQNPASLILPTTFPHLFTPYPHSAGKVCSTLYRPSTILIYNSFTDCAGSYLKLAPNLSKDWGAPHYLHMAWSGAGMFLLLLLALIFLMFILDKVGLDREVMRVALLAPVIFAIYRMGVVKAFLGGALITVIVAAPLALFHYTPLPRSPDRNQ